MQQGEETIQENKMGTMPVNRLLITMSIPMIISMLVQALYNVVDSVFVSQINENALTAVSMAFPIQNLMIAVAVGTGVGTNALLSRSLGEKNQDMANKAANNSVFLACACYFPYFGFDQFGTFLQASDGHSGDHQLWKRVCILCLCFVFWSVFAGGL